MARPAVAQRPSQPQPSLLQRAGAAWRALSGKNQALYEAGSTSKRTSTWRPPTSTANSMLGTLGLVRDRSRHAVRNDGYAWGITDKLVSNLIGTGIKPLSQAPDRAFRLAVQRLWNAWVEVSDADGQCDFYGQQALAVRVWLEGGDSFGRLRNRLASDGLPVPIQLQVIEPELVPYSYHGYAAATGNKVRAGIEFDALGRRVAYYFHPSRPEVDDFDSAQLRRIPAESVVHLYETQRGGQLRGMPWLTRALVKLHELDKFDDAALLRQQIGNLFGAFVSPGNTPPEQEDLNPMTGQPTSVDSDNVELVTLVAGTVQELSQGEEIKFSDPPDPPATYADFIRQHLRSVSVATGVPYEVLTGDMTGMNDRTMRVVLNEFKRRMQQLQHSVIAFRFCRPVWQAWLDRAILSGALPTPEGYGTDPLKPWAAVMWTPQRWAYIHPVQDVDAQVAEVRAGLTSRSAIVSENGEDAEEIDRQQAEDNARADQLKLQYSSDGRQPLSGPSASSAAVATEAALAGAAA